MRFTWIDTESGEQDVNLFGANGQNDWEKGLGSALTYAERYFLLKFFHIATDKDDVDNEQRKKTDHLAKLVKLEIGTPNFEGCKNALKSGYTVEQMRKKYEISKEVEEALING